MEVVLAGDLYVGVISLQIIEISQNMKLQSPLELWIIIYLGRKESL